MTKISMTEFQRIVREAGIADFGVVPAGESETWEFFSDWLDAGNGAEMLYLERYRDARKNPGSILPGVQTIIVTTVPLNSLPAAPVSSLTSTAENGPMGRIASYASVVDYHQILRARLQKVVAFLRENAPDQRFRVVVDTAPLPEKEWALRAGLGRTGLNSLFIHPQLGSRLFIGSILTTLPPDAFLPALSESPSLSEKLSSQRIDSRCQACQRCRRACPTGAILANGTIDARRCLNYWTIEYRGDNFPADIREKLGDRLFGCESCQEVCPVNECLNVPKSPLIPLSLVDKMTEEEFQACFNNTPVERIGLSGLQRNARQLNPDLS